MMVEQLVQTDTPPTDGQISFEDFLRIYDGQFAEWLDGEVVLMSPVADQHDELVFFLRVLLWMFLTARPGGKLRQGPFTMRILGKRHGREPDLMFIKTEHADRLKRNYVDGPADIVVEIISPESAERDRGEKFKEYELAGVPEYWLLDPTDRNAAFYHLATVKNKDDVDELRYQQIEPDVNGDFHSIEIPGFRLHVELLWRAEMPDDGECREIVRAMLS